MSIPTAENDNSKKVMDRIEVANNKYTYSYSRHAVEGCLNMGIYTATPHKDFAGDNFWSIRKR